MVRPAEPAAATAEPEKPPETAAPPATAAGAGAGAEQNENAATQNRSSTSNGKPKHLKHSAETSGRW